MSGINIFNGMAGSNVTAAFLGNSNTRTRNNKINDLAILMIRTNLTDVVSDIRSTEGRRLFLSSNGIIRANGSDNEVQAAWAELTSRVIFHSAQRSQNPSPGSAYSNPNPPPPPPQ